MSIGQGNRYELALIDFACENSSDLFEVRSRYRGKSPTCSGRVLHSACDAGRNHEVHTRAPDAQAALSPGTDVSRCSKIRRRMSAQSCWEVRLQDQPNNVDYHLGLLRCLRNLGHYGELAGIIRPNVISNRHFTDTHCRGT